MAQKPSIPKGTRDFGPVEMAKRNYIFNTIKEVYALYGFQQIETPAMETLQTLMGKYGEEGDKLLFKILNSGDYMNKVSDEDIHSLGSLKLAAKLCEKGLRYDLTVPFARYVVQHREELQMPFKRYQIQPVWRADRPQKGLYREFYQCDADVVGSDSLLNEVELMQIVDTVFTKFGVRVCIKINNRKILTGIAEVIGEAEKIVDITVAIDKLDKIGLDNVNEELRNDGISEDAIEKLQPIISLSGTNDEKLEVIAKVLEVGLKGVEETKFILDTLKTLGLNNEIELDLTLARGLNYYTGAIFEVKALDTPTANLEPISVAIVNLTEAIRLKYNKYFRWLPVYYWLVLVLSITAKPTTTNRTLSLLRRGTAQKFDLEMQQREIAVKQSKADHLVLNPLTVKMPSDAFHDITIYPGYWINRGMANYYGKKTVVALPFDDGEETPAKLLKRCRDEVGPGGMTFIEGK